MPRSILCRYSSTNGDRNTYPCRPKAGLRSRTNVEDEDRRIRPQGRVEEEDLPALLAQLLAERYTRTVETTASEAPVQDEQRKTWTKTWTGTPAARQRAMVEEIPLSNSAQLQQRESRNRESIGQLISELKVQGCRFLYRLPGGSQPAHQAMWD